MLTGLYGVVLIIGVVAVVAWIVLAAIASMVAGWEHVDPERTFGTTGRAVVAGVFGFGMAGISMLYTEFPDVLSFVAAVAGAALLVVIVTRIVPPSQE